MKRAITMRKDLGARAFGFGWPVPVLMVATYNDDGSVNVMNRGFFQHAEHFALDDSPFLLVQPYGQLIGYQRFIPSRPELNGKGDVLAVVIPRNDLIIAAALGQGGFDIAVQAIMEKAKHVKKCRLAVSILAKEHGHARQIRDFRLLKYLILLW